MYLIDGYNLLFTLAEIEEKDKAVRFLQKRFAALKMTGIVVFDGKESGRSYPSPLEIVYTQKGQTADAFIIEKLEASQNPREITVVTNDRGLIANARALGAQVIANKDFIERLLSQKKKDKTEMKDSKKNIERLLIIFEKKLHEEE